MGRLRWAVVVLLLALAACGQGKVELQPEPGAESEPASQQSLSDVLAELDALPTPEGVKHEAFAGLKAALREMLFASGESKFTSKLPKPGAADPQDLAVQATSCRPALEWSYRNQGDYDQNSETNIADLTPLGVHLGKTSASPDWNAARVADGDGNGEVNISDITPIGANFFGRVSGYIVETSGSPDPAGPWGRIGQVSAVDAPLPPGGGFKRLSFRPQLAAHGVYFRLKPYSNEPLGQEVGAPTPSVGFPGDPPTPATDWYERIGNSMEFNLPSIAADGTLYLGSNNNHLFAVSSSGTELWNFRTNADVYHSTVAPDGTIYLVNQDARLYALSPAGSQTWMVELPAPLRDLRSGITGDSRPGRPAARPNNGVCFVTDDNVLRAFGSDGTEAWIHPGMETLLANPAVAADGTVYVSEYGGALIALAADGSDMWTYFPPDGAFNVTVVSPPAVGLDDKVYVLVDLLGGFGSRPALDAVNPDGSHAWRAEKTDARILWPPQVSLSGAVYVHWEFDDAPYPLVSTLAEWYAPDGTLAGAFPSPDPLSINFAEHLGLNQDGLMVVGHFEGLVGVNADSSERWTHSQLAFSGQLFASPTLQIFSVGGYVQEYDPASGALGWVFGDGADFTFSDPVLGIDGNLVVLADGLRKYAPNGTLLRHDTMVQYDAFSQPVVDASGNMWAITRDSNFDSHLEHFDSSGGQLWISPPFDSFVEGFGLDGECIAYVLDSRSLQKDLLLAFDASGALLWEFETAFTFGNGPLVAADGTTLMADLVDGVQAVAPDGSELWLFNPGSFITDMALARDEQAFYIAAEGEIHAYSLEPAHLWTYSLGTGMYASINVGPNGSVYLGVTGSGGTTGKLTALNADGTLAWEVDGFIATGGFSYSIDGSVLYSGGADRYLYAFSTAEGTELDRWYVEDPVQQTPVVGPGGNVYIWSDGNLRSVMVE